MFRLLSFEERMYSISISRYISHHGNGAQVTSKMGFLKSVLSATENYSKKTGFRSNKSRHCAYITYSVKICFLELLSVPTC